MILVDASLLLHAYHPRSPRHARARDWLEAVFAGPAPARLAWSSIVDFLRTSTSPRVFRQPLSMAEAETAVAAWLALPAVDTLDPGDRHWSILQGLLAAPGLTAPQVADAALAALAIEHGALLCSTDPDFTRFPGLRAVNPLGD